MSSEVKPFRADLCVRPIMVVPASDYAALEAENARLREERDSFQRVSIRAMEERDRDAAARDQYRALSIKYGDKLSETLKERDTLRSELAAVKGQEAVAVVKECKYLIGDKSDEISELLPVGTKLYALPPASPDVEGLVKALELIADTDPDDGTAWFHEVADTALSTWRQSHP